MDQILVALGSLILLGLGLAHGCLAIVDVFRPTWFTPTDPAVREAMQKSKINLSADINLWRAWLGFNLSHSLGLIVFGGSVLAIAAWSFESFSHNGFVQLLVIAITTIYFLLSFFWYWGPATATAICLACFLGAAIFC